MERQLDTPNIGEGLNGPHSYLSLQEHPMPHKPDYQVSALIEQYLTTVLNAKNNVVTKDSNALFGACILAAVHMAQGKELPVVDPPVPDRKPQKSKGGVDRSRTFKAPTGVSKPKKEAPSEPAESISE
jgi:hypothetical protein